MCNNVIINIIFFFIYVLYIRYDVIHLDDMLMKRNCYFVYERLYYDIRDND